MGRSVGKTVGGDVGRALRRVRTARGFTLRDVGIRSGGTFTPTAVAGYERGERKISLQRFCELSAFYGVEPELLLAEALHRDDRELVVDLTPFEEPARTTTTSKRPR
jgi:transcriptional regulator with XRE-family HTH domain